MAQYFDSVKLQKDMYNHGGKSFTQVLENLDPSENYKGTSYESMDAFQRQLMRFDIKVKGANTSTVEKFFLNPESAVLFPEFVARSVRAGMDESGILPAILATTTYTESIDYRAITVPSTKPEAADEGNPLTVNTFRTNSAPVAMKKYSYLFDASYESLRAQRLDLVSIIFKRIGQNIANAQLEDIIDVVSGTANNYKVGTNPISGTSGAISYNALVDFWNTFDGYNMDAMLVSRDVAVKMLKLSEFQNAQAGLNFQGTGRLITPLGATLIPTGVVPAGKIYGLDHSCAIEMIAHPEIIIDHEKFISAQSERVAITPFAGFSAICPDAVAALVV